MLPREQQRRFLEREGWIAWSGPAISELLKQFIAHNRMMTGGFAINGQRASSTNILLDGAANNDEFTASIGEPVPLDAVQELSIISSNFSAQYGRATGGIVNVVTKAGSNQFHGTADYFFRNDSMTGQTVDQESRGTSKSQFSRHQPSFSLGGPIRKDRAQFFVAGEYTRVRSTKTDICARVTDAFGQ